MALTTLTKTRAWWTTFKLKIAGAVSRSLHDKLLETGITVKDFGAVGDGLVDDSASINAAYSSGYPVHFPEGTYLMSELLDIKTRTTGIKGKSIIKMVNPLLQVRAAQKIVECDVSNITIDCTGSPDIEYGLFIDAEYNPEDEVISNVVVLGVTSLSYPSAMGIVLYRSDSSGYLDGKFTFSGCIVKNITGLSIGKGIFVGFNNKSHAISRLYNCVGESITPATDADAFHVKTAAYTDLLSEFRGSCVISGCHASSSLPMKRGYKIQYPNCYVAGNTCIADNVTLGYDTYSKGTILIGNTYTNNTVNGEAYDIHMDDTVLSDCVIDTQTQAIAIRVETGTTGSLNRINISNVQINYRGTALSGLGIMSIYDSQVTLNNVHIKATNKAGVGILYKGDSEVTMLGGSIEGSEVGINSNFSAGWASLNGTKIKGVDKILSVNGDNGSKAIFSYCNLQSDSIGVHGVESTNKVTVRMLGCEVDVALHGYLGSTASDVIKDNNFIASTNTGLGGLFSSGAEVSGNTFTGFGTGMGYNYSTDTIVHSNTMINCTIPLTNTGATPFVDFENNSR